MTQLGDQETDEVDIDNVLAAIIDDRIYPDITGGLLRYYLYFRQPDTNELHSAEADYDIVDWLVANRWATTDTAHHLTATELGEYEHGNTWFLLEVLTATYQGRTYPTNRYDRFNRRRMYVYEPTDGDLFADREFSVDPFVNELAWLELDDELVPHLTDAGVHRLELFGILEPAE